MVYILNIIYNPSKAHKEEVMISCEDIQQNELKIRQRYMNTRLTDPESQRHEEIMAHLQTCKRRKCMDLYEYLNLIEDSTKLQTNNQA